MRLKDCRGWTLACLFSLSLPAWATTVEITHTAKNAAVELGRKVWFLGKVDGKGVYMNFAVNGIPGGNAAVGTLNSQNGEYIAPAAMPANPVITVTGTTAKAPQVSGSTRLTLVVAGTSSGGTSTTPTPTPPPRPRPARSAPSPRLMPPPLPPPACWSAPPSAPTPPASPPSSRWARKPG